MKRIMVLVSTALALSIVAVGARAAEIGHFNGGFMNIRDYFVPAEPGFYAALYNYYYHTERLNNDGGDKIGTLLLKPGPGPGVPVSVSVDVDLYAVSPAVIWEPDVHVLGGRYAALIAPSFANASVEAGLSIGSRIGRDPSNSSFNVGDMFVQPLWLGWSFDHFDVSAAYGFYAAVGKYDVDTRFVPVLGTTLKADDPDNIGYGFWTHQFQSALAWYPFDNKGTAVTGVVTYEHHSDKKDYDLTPGDDITLNWGISQYIPLTGDQHLLLEIGPAGWNGWQVSPDRGADASQPSRDRNFAAGGQIGLTYVPWGLATNFHAFYEYYSRDRFQGTALGLSIAKKF
jgi:hypothetical protein